ncbi:MAG: transmembrane anchor protein [Hylemonella sp.]|nr:transmembrane anchor protein [Hylemonella sp.]
MYNSETPLQAELPSSRQLARSTFLAAVAAIILLVAVVLPAEYGIDPTGVGRSLGLTDMGEIKTRLAKEAAQEAAPQQASASSGEIAAPIRTATPAVDTVARPWRDELAFTLKPGEGTEFKMRMKEGDKVGYAWNVEGEGVVNFDTHGDGGGRSISYERGRGVSADEGELVAAFTGNHGWFWRNRGQADVQVVLRTRGDYSDIKRVK